MKHRSPPLSKLSTMSPKGCFLVALTVLQHSRSYCCHANTTGSHIMITARSIQLFGRRSAFASAASPRCGMRNAVMLISTPSNVVQRRTRHGENQAHRRRRGAMHSSQRRKRLSGTMMASPLASESNDEYPSTITQYTIDDSVCPPTDPELLRKVVKKHINTLPRYWNSKPVAKHTKEAFELALDFVIDYGRTSVNSRTKVILDSGCGTGRSSLILGKRYPDCVVIGIE